MTDPLDLKRNLGQAGLDCLENHTWPELTLSAICHAAKIDLRDLPDNLDKAKIGYAIPTLFDLAMHDYEPEPSDRRADRLFDILMLRCEAMEDHRSGLEKYLDHAHKSPHARLHLSKVRLKTAKTALTIAGMDAEDGVSFLVKTKLFALTVRNADIAWLDEDSAVYSKTMVALQENIRRFEDRLAQLKEPFKIFNRSSAPENTKASDLPDIEIAR